MGLDADLVRENLIERNLRRWLRILEARFRATPLGTGLGASRFSSPIGAFHVLYAASTLRGAVAERVIRDRFEMVSKDRRVLTIGELQSWAIVEISTIQPLRLLDLTGPGLLRIGADTEVMGNKDHRKGQDFAQEIHDGFPEIDRMLYPSRLSSDPCVMVFDRALSSLSLIHI